jgi:hypothetical protein
VLRELFAFLFDGTAVFLDDETDRDFRVQLADVRQIQRLQRHFPPFSAHAHI